MIPYSKTEERMACHKDGMEDIACIHHTTKISAYNYYLSFYFKIILN